MPEMMGIVLLADMLSKGTHKPHEFQEQINRPVKQDVQRVAPALPALGAVRRQTESPAILTPGFPRSNYPFDQAARPIWRPVLTGSRRNCSTSIISVSA